jgi:F420-0:gamma-glutamyl ligase
MIVRSIKTGKILPGSGTIFDVLDKSIKNLKEGSIVAITSKIVAICEGRTVPLNLADKEELIIQESDYYLPKKKGSHGHRTIAEHTLVSGAGIDESNAGGNYVLLPKDPQKSANEIRAYLVNKLGFKTLGVVITDSVSTPLRLGASGIAMGWSGFEALKNYRGTPDLFGRKFKTSRADIAGGLAAAAVLVMGEGSEQTPIAIIQNVPFIKFQSRNPTKEELEYMNFAIEDDLFAPLLDPQKWQKGGKSN